MFLKIPKVFKKHDVHDYQFSNFWQNSSTETRAFYNYLSQRDAQFVSKISTTFILFKFYEKCLWRFSYRREIVICVKSCYQQPVQNFRFVTQKVPNISFPFDYVSTDWNKIKTEIVITSYLTSLRFNIHKRCIMIQIK